MVFSKATQKIPSALKVVELSRLKPGKNWAGSIGGVVQDCMDAQPGPSSAMEPPLPLSEEYLKLEPEEIESTMYRSSDCEFFQDLGLWCSAPAKEEQVQIIDHFKTPDEKSINTDTPHTQYSPAGDPCMAISPRASLYHGTPNEPLSPADGYDKFFYPDLGSEKKLGQEQFLDISSLPIVIEDMHTHPASGDWSAHTDYTRPYTDTHNPFIDQDDSLDLKLSAVVPRELEWDDVVISELVVGGQTPAAPPRRGLTLDVVSRAAAPGHVISTPEVLSYVEQLEKEKCPAINTNLSVASAWPALESSLITPEDSRSPAPAPERSPRGSDDDDPKPARKRRRRSSDDSDETYTPYETPSPRKYRRRKPGVPITDMIRALEDSQPTTKARRGRPPKRRDSAVSSVCSGDTSTFSSSDLKYREVRDKNNEASKRSRMSRKLKELQMEQEALQLEERNKLLIVKAGVLEGVTKRLKEALMSAILKQ